MSFPLGALSHSTPVPAFLHSFALGKPVVLTTDEGDTASSSSRSQVRRKQEGDAATEAAVAGTARVSGVLVTVTVLGMNWRSKSATELVRQLSL